MKVWISQVTPVIDYSVRGICVRKYEGHPRGCPNFDCKKGCPPSAPKFDVYFDMAKPIYAIVTTFDLGGHRERMKLAHPHWSERQLVNCLYWQSGARAALKREVKIWLKEHPLYEANFCPEALGVNITETLLRIGLTLEWPPRHWARQVALAGVPIQIQQPHAGAPQMEMFR